jgi:hypothetical protein
MFRRGLIDKRRVKVFDSQLGHLSSDTIEAVSNKVLDRAEGLTTGQLQARLAREVMEADPKGADVGYEKGLADRRMTTYANPDGTANQGVYSIAPEEAAAVSRKVNRLALALKHDSEPQTSTSSEPTFSSASCWGVTRASAPIVVLSISMLMLPPSPNCRMPLVNWQVMARSLPTLLARSPQTRPELLGNSPLPTMTATSSPPTSLRDAPPPP